VLRGYTDGGIATFATPLPNAPLPLPGQLMTSKRTRSFTPWGAFFATLSGLFGLTGCVPEKASVWKRTDGKWSYEGSPFEAADPETLKAIDGRFAADAVQAYYRGTPLSGSDPATLVILDEHHARDRRAVFWCDTYRKGQDYYTVRYVRVEPILNADPATYRVLKYEYGADAKRAFKAGQWLRAVRDPASFTVLTPRLARDNRRAYFEDIEIPDSDGATFEIIDVHDDAWVRDREHVWHVRNGQPAAGEPVTREVRMLVGAQAPSLHPLGNEYATDGVRLWWRGTAIRDAELTSFASVDGDDTIDARDSRGPFVRGKRVVVKP
jgi:hypothetical protein